MGVKESSKRAGEKQRVSRKISKYLISYVEKLFGKSINEIIKKYDISSKNQQELEGNLLLICALKRKGWKDLEIKNVLPLFNEPIKLYFGASTLGKISFSHLLGAGFLTAKNIDHIAVKDKLVSKMNCFLEDSIKSVSSLFDSSYSDFIKHCKNDLQLAIKWNSLSVAMTYASIKLMKGEYKEGDLSKNTDIFYRFYSSLKFPKQLYSGSNESFKKYLNDAFNQPREILSYYFYISLSLLQRGVYEAVDLEKVLGAEAKVWSALILPKLAIQHSRLDSKTANGYLKVLGLVSQKLDYIARKDHKSYVNLISSFCDYILKKEQVGKEWIDEVFYKYSSLVGIKYKSTYRPLFLIYDISVLEKVYSRDKNLDGLFESVKSMCSLFEIDYSMLEKIISGNVKDWKLSGYLFSSISKRGWSEDEIKHIFTSLISPFAYGYYQKRLEGKSKQAILGYIEGIILKLPSKSDMLDLAEKRYKGANKEYLRQAALNLAIEKIYLSSNKYFGKVSYEVGFSSKANAIKFRNMIKSFSAKELKVIAELFGFDYSTLDRFTRGDFSLVVYSDEDIKYKQKKLTQLYTYLELRSKGYSHKLAYSLAVKEKKEQTIEDVWLNKAKDILKDKQKNLDLLYAVAGFLKQGVSKKNLEKALSKTNDIKELSKMLSKEKYVSKVVTAHMRKGVINDENVKFLNKIFFTSGMHKFIPEWFSRFNLSNPKQFGKYHAGDIRWYKDMYLDYYSKLESKFKSWKQIKEYSKQSKLLSSVVAGIENLAKIKKINKKQVFFMILSIIHCEYSWVLGDVNTRVLRNGGFAYKTNLSKMDGITLEQIVELEKTGLMFKSKDLVNALKYNKGSVLEYVDDKGIHKIARYENDKVVSSSINIPIDSVFIIRDKNGKITHFLSGLTFWARVKSLPYLGNRLYSFSKNGSVRSDYTLLNLTMLGGWSGNFDIKITYKELLKQKNLEIVKPPEKLEAPNLFIVRHEQGLPLPFALTSFGYLRESRLPEVYIPVFSYSIEPTYKYVYSASIINKQLTGDEILDYYNAIFGPSLDSNKSWSYIEKKINDAIKSSSIHDYLVKHNGNGTFYINRSGISLSKPTGGYIKVVCKNGRMYLYGSKSGESPKLIGSGKLNVKKIKDLIKSSLTNTRAPVFLSFSNLASYVDEYGGVLSLDLKLKTMWIYKHGLPSKLDSGVSFIPQLTYRRKFGKNVYGGFNIVYYDGKVLFLPELSISIPISEHNHTILGLSLAYSSGKIVPGAMLGTNFGKLRLGLGGGPGYILFSLGYDKNKDGLPEWGISIIHTGPVWIPDLIINGRGIFSSILTPVLKPISKLINSIFPFFRSKKRGMNDEERSAVFFNLSTVPKRRA